MKKISMLLLIAVIAYSQQKPMSPDMRIARTSITNATGVASDVVVKTDRLKVSLELNVISTNNCSLMIYSLPHVTNVWVATNIVAERVTNLTAIAVNRVVTNVLTNVVTHVWANVVTSSNTRSFTNSAADRTNITTYRYTVPFAFTLTNITPLTTSTNIRTLTILSPAWITFTNEYITVFTNASQENSIVTNIITAYKSNIIIGQRKYISTVYVTNVITNTYLSGYTNTLTNTTYNYYTNAFVNGMVTLLNPSRVAKSNTFSVHKDQVITNAGTRIASNYVAGVNTKATKITLDKRSTYLFRVVGSTNTVFNFVFSELK